MGVKRLKIYLPIVGVIALIWLLNVSRPGGSVEGCPQGCAQGAAMPDGTLRVASLNMLHGFPDFDHLPERLEIIANEITRLQADIVLLQEVPGTMRHGNAAQYLAERTGMNYLYLRANGNRWAIFFEEGEAILSRFPLQQATGVVLQPRAGFFENRVALSAIAVTPFGELRLVSTHLTNGKAEVNRAQVEYLKKMTSSPAGQLTIIAGDFNARDDAPQIQGTGWVDSFRAANPTLPGYTCCVRDLTQPPGTALSKRIDYIFLIPGSLEAEILSSQLAFEQPVKTQAGWLWASDHIGLLTILGFE
jgi:endonuclease/exonuclease/phosphatase family metal-dependent hydrolase